MGNIDALKAQGYREVKRVETGRRRMGNIVYIDYLVTMEKEGEQKQENDTKTADRDEHIQAIQQRIRKGLSIGQAELNIIHDRAFAYYRSTFSEFGLPDRTDKRSEWADRAWEHIDQNLHYATKENWPLDELIKYCGRMAGSDMRGELIRAEIIRKDTNRKTRIRRLNWSKPLLLHRKAYQGMPTYAGCYVIADVTYENELLKLSEMNLVLYVGEATNLRERFLLYCRLLYEDNLKITDRTRLLGHGGIRELKRYIKRHPLRHLQVMWVQVDASDMYRGWFRKSHCDLEDELIDDLFPVCNRKRGRLPSER